MSRVEFDPPIFPDDEQYILPGKEENCESVDRCGYQCTLDKGHAPPHVAHGIETVDDVRVDAMYATWDDAGS